MPHLNVPADVDAWFAENGWSPGRNAGEQASAFVAEVVEESRKSGFPLEPFAAATDFLTEHAGLRVTTDAQRQDHLHFTPVPVWGDLFEDIAELSRGLGARVFPIGWDSAEGEILVIDEQGRFFNMSSFGNYYMGTGKHGAMIGLFHWPMQDAEDLYV
ncbi:SUKH-3 domain-containing protein [Streptomyces globisporus]|uniref:SUKH-3 domain-containing protein n=1 Tax=Streptomyces globisporus TaxID=1908 RepID=UPI0004C73BE2|nr:SUKH-3 domain-containing protein [Streptomyces globisporus]